MREGPLSGRLSIRGRIVLELAGLCLWGTVSVFDVVIVTSERPLSPCVSPLATGDSGCGESERDSLRLKHMEEEFSSLDEESGKEQSSSERWRGGGDGHASGGGSSSESPSSPFPRLYGKPGQRPSSTSRERFSSSRWPLGASLAEKPPFMFPQCSAGAAAAARWGTWFIRWGGGSISSMEVEMAGSFLRLPTSPMPPLSSIHCSLLDPYSR